MTTKEMSNEFDIQYNSISSNSAPSLDLYEKSVYLTRAQLQIIKNYFEPNGNKYKKGFEQSSKRRNDLKELIKTYNAYNGIVDPEKGLSDLSKFFKIPANVFLIIQEQAISLDSDLCYNKKALVGKKELIPNDPLKKPNPTLETLYAKAIGKPPLSVIPKSHDEYNIQIKNPFKKPDENTVWRIDYGYSNYLASSKNIELISKYDIYVYKLRYISYPTPIVLTDLDLLYPNENLTIDDVTEETECRLNKSIHSEIVDRAVELALIDYKPEQSLGLKAQMNLRNE